MRSLLDGPVSADAWAIERGYSVLAVRPRMTELFKAGLIYKVGTAESIDGNPQNVFQMGVIHVVRILDPSLHYRGPIGGYTVDAVIDETLTRIRSESIADAALAQEWWEAQAALVRRKYEIQPDSRDEVVQSTRPHSGR